MLLNTYKKMGNQTDSKRIARNALFLYVRMFFSLSISLLTSRVILRTLGIEDFGVYGLVAGIISLFSFLNTSMSGATSRFLAYELEKGTRESLQKIFSGAMTIHCFIALSILFLGETIGFWFLHNKLVIPPERCFATDVIYQISIFSSIITVIQVPYNAMIMANERMNIYAYVEMLNVTLKLLIVYLLLIISGDKLIVYGLLLLAVTLLIFMIYRLYCIRRLSACHFSLIRNWQILRPMLLFSGWDLYGNASTLARTQGVNMLLNIFFGTVLNAASGIATQVQGAVMSFANNVLVAFRPQIIKSYAAGEYDRMISYINKAAGYTTLLLLLFTIPLIAEAEFVLTVWLGEWPAYTAILVRCVLIFNLFANLSSVVICGIHATGNIKRPSLINGTLYLSVIPIAYIAYCFGMPPQSAFIYNIVAVICGMVSNVWTLHLYVKSFSMHYYASIFLKNLFIGLSAYCSAICMRICMPECWCRLLCVIVISTAIIISLAYGIVLSASERIWFKTKIRSYYGKRVG